MSGNLVVRSADLEAAIDFAAFAGLPREEVERLQGCVEVLHAGGTASSLPLFVLCVAHYNYSWLVTTSGPGAPLRSLCLASPLTAADCAAPSFLGAGMVAAAHATIDGYIRERGDQGLSLYSRTPHFTPLFRQLGREKPRHRHHS